MRESDAAMPIETIEAVLGSEPHESLVILSDLAHARLGELLRVFHTAECDVITVNEGDRAR